jgi:succinoglycan biosynthesis protein ExoA
VNVLIVIPTLNEAAHIGALLQGLIGYALRSGARIAVVDGGSTDGTQAIVESMALENANIILLGNPRRLQSAAVNLAVATLGQEATFLIRIDAHAAYPADYCDVLVAEAERTGADAVVVSMFAVGKSPLQRQIAIAQNSPLGNGGSAHRNRTRGEWVEHGHHALMRIAAFERVGGYDESFSHNEDAELDHRLRKNGFSIWLTAATRIEYYPRATVLGLLKQYYRFGRGRARNLAKHGISTNARQAIVAALAPLLLLAVFGAINHLFMLPFLLWLAGCLAGGLWFALRRRDLRSLQAGPIAGCMQAAWSAGYWVERASVWLKFQRRS